jgi:archaellum component FlaC
MRRHYERQNENYSNENIDRTKTHLNYNLSPGHDPQETIREAVAASEAVLGHRVRKDAVLMVDWVITAPKDLKPASQRMFFETSSDFLAERYGKDNVLGAWVHMDETTPHMHFAFMPRVEGRFNAKQVLTRTDLSSFHGDLSRVVQERLGYRVSIELDEKQTQLKALSALPQKEYIAAREGLDTMRSEEVELQKRLERLRSREGELTQEVTVLREAPKIFGLGKTIKILREHVSELTERITGFRERISEFGARVEQIRERIVKAREYALEHPEERRETIAEQIEHARRSAEEHNRERGERRRDRGRGLVR